MVRINVRDLPADDPKIPGLSRLAKYAAEDVINLSARHQTHAKENFPEKTLRDLPDNLANLNGQLLDEIRDRDISLLNGDEAETLFIILYSDKYAPLTTAWKSIK